MQVIQAINLLTDRFLSPEQAVNQLRVFQEAGGLLRVCQHFFPNEFATCNRALMARADELHEALTECLELVSNNLFVIPDFLLDEMDVEDLPFSSIPIEPFLQEWWNDDFDEMFLLWQVLLVLIGAAEIDEISSDTLRAANHARQQWEDRILDCSKLARACRRAAPPLCWLNKALLTLDHSTGNPWLDASYECPIQGYDWTIRNAKFLQKKWREANEVFTQIMSLNAWLNEDDSRIHQVLALWAQGLIPRQKNEL
jgi:hypothetical protein